MSTQTQILGENHIQFFSFGEVYCRIDGVKFSFVATHREEQ